MRLPTSSCVRAPNPQPMPAYLPTRTSTDTADASDHVGAAKAIAAGLVASHSKEKPGYWLHTGGTGILTFPDSDSGEYGKRRDKMYNDWEGVDELLNLPDHAFHRNVDRLVLEAGTKHADVLKTALVCPPTIYGKISRVRFLCFTCEGPRLLTFFVAFFNDRPWPWPLLATQSAGVRACEADDPAWKGSDCRSWPICYEPYPYP